MTTLPINTSDAKVRVRFDGYVDRRGADECWPWRGPRTRSGHGQIWDGKRNVAAHRYALEACGTAVVDAIVCHRCNNPSCVNPAHLYAGTYQSNIDDAIAAGIKFGNPAPKGGKNHNALFTAAQVRAIRRRYIPNDSQHGTRALAREFGVVQNTISKIVRGLTWRHLL